MPRRTPGPVRRETDKSIAAAAKDGTLDRALAAGPIAALRKLADQIDHPDFPVIDGRLDNVSLPTYLRYCDQLRLTPASRAPAKGRKDPEEGGGSGGDGDGKQGGGTVANLRDAERKRAGRSRSA